MEIAVTVRVGFTTQRPVIPDQHIAFVILATPITDHDFDRAEQHARLKAAHVLASHPGVVMVTRTDIVAIEA